MSAPSKKSSFARLKSEKARRLIASAAQGSAYKLTAWTAGQKHMIDTRVSAAYESGGAFLIALPAGAREKTFLEGVQSSEKGCFFSLNLTTDLLFFRGELRAEGAFQVIEPIYMVERREDLRVRVPASPATAVSFELVEPFGHLLTGELLDLSSGGCSVVISEAPGSDSLHAGTEIQDLRFAFGKIRVRTEGVVRYRRKTGRVGRTPGIRLGIAFVGLASDVQSALYRAIVEQSMKFVNR